MFPSARCGASPAFASQAQLERHIDPVFSMLVLLHRDGKRLILRLQQQFVRQQGRLPCRARKSAMNQGSEAAVAGGRFSWPLPIAFGYLISVTRESAPMRPALALRRTAFHLASSIPWAVMTGTAVGPVRNFISSHAASWDFEPAPTAAAKVM